MGNQAGGGAVAHPDLEEAATRVAAELAPQLGDSLRICILGGSEGEEGLSSATADLVKAVASELPTKVGRKACLVSGGHEGIGKLFAQHCRDGSTLWNVVPRGHSSGFGCGRDVQAGETIEEAQAAIACLGDLFVIFEGGNVCSKQALHAHERGAGVLLVRCTGGASGGCFPEALLEKPRWASEEQWRLIASSDAAVADSAAAILAAVEAWLTTMEANSLSPSAVPGKLQLSYGAAGKLNLQYQANDLKPSAVLPTIGKLQLSYGAAGKLNLAHQQADEVMFSADSPKTGHLQLSYGVCGKLNLAYQQSALASAAAIEDDSDLEFVKGADSAITGKLQLAYGVCGKLNLAYQQAGLASASVVAGRVASASGGEVVKDAGSSKIGSLQLSYGEHGKLNLAYKLAGAGTSATFFEDEGNLEFVKAGVRADAVELAAAEADVLEGLADIDADFAAVEAKLEKAKDDEWEFVEPTFQKSPEAVSLVPPAEPFQWTVDSGELPPVPRLDPQDDSASSPAASERKPQPPQLPLNPRTSATSLDSIGSASGTPSSFSFKLLAPPPRPSCSVGSPAVSKTKEVVFEELITHGAVPVLSSPSKAEGVPDKIEANLAAVAAALAVGPPARVQLDSKLKVFRSGEDGAAVEGEAAAVDADVDDEACETLLSGVDDPAGQGFSPNRSGMEGSMPLGRMRVDDGMGSESEDETANSPHGIPAPKRPEAPSSPDADMQPRPPSPQRTGADQTQANARGPVKGAQLAEVDAYLTRTIDKFFGDDRLWQQVVAELGQCPKLTNSLEWLQVAAVQPPFQRSQWKVQVPEPYPGIQYRKSKTLTDRYTRYAKHGTVVSGHLEDNGEWLRVADNVFLPSRVGAVEILKAVQVDNREVNSPFPDSQLAGSRTSTAISTVNNSRWCNGCDPGVGGRNGDVSAPGPPENSNLGEVVVPPDNSMPQVHGLMRNAIEAASEGGFSAVRNGSLEIDDDHMEVNRISMDDHPMGPLSHLDEASRLLSGSEPINPFTDTPRGGSPNNTPLKSRGVSDPMVPINPFSDTPPGGNSPRASPLRMRPSSIPK